MNIPLKCKCGALRGLARDVSPATGKRIVCLCDDCQAYAYYLGRPEILDANGGTDVFPMMPAKLTITQGAEHLRSMRLSPKGMFRWYAGCCKTPIANTMPTPRIPFAGVVHAIMDHAGAGVSRDEALGPIFARVHARFGYGPMPADASRIAPLRAIVWTLRFFAVSFLRRGHVPSPFFDAETGQARVAPYVLGKTEREALRAGGKSTV